MVDRRMDVRCGALLLAGSLCVLPVSARAQQCDAPEAERLFHAGLQRAEQRQLGAAREAYAGSLAACPRVPTAYNLAVVQRQLGDVLAARVLLNALIDGDYGSVSPDQRQVIRQVLRESRDEVSRIVVIAIGAPSAMISVDGRQMGVAEENTEMSFEINPGSRLVRATAEDDRTAELVVRVAAGRSQTVRLELPLSSPRSHLIVTAEDPEADSSIFESPWLWILTGLVVVGAATAAVLAISLDGSEPIEDPVWGRVAPLGP